MRYGCLEVHVGVGLMWPIGRLEECKAEVNGANGSSALISSGSFVFRRLSFLFAFLLLLTCHWLGLRHSFQSCSVDWSSC